MRNENIKENDLVVCDKASGCGYSDCPAYRVKIAKHCEYKYNETMGRCARSANNEYIHIIVIKKGNKNDKTSKKRKTL